MTATLSPPPALTERLLAEADLPAVIALHHEVRRALAADLLAAESDAFFADHLERAGRILGLHDGPRLVAYAVLGLPRPGDHTFASYLDLPADIWPQVAHLDGVSVAKDWRHHGLHRRLIRRRLDLARSAGRRLAISTVAPGNLPSLSNNLAEGMEIRRLSRLYGGWRFVTARELDAPSEPATAGDSGRWLATDDLHGQDALLCAGWRGVALRRGADGRPEVLYRPVENT